MGERAANAAPPPVEFVDLTVLDSANSHGADPNNINGKADPGETVGVQVTIHNVSGGPLSGLTGELSVSFGGVPVPVVNPGPKDYPDLATDGSGLNMTPFTVPLDQRYACGGRLSLELTVRSAGNVIGRVWAPLPLGKFLGGEYENTTPVGDAAMQQATLVRRGDGFGLFYLFTEATRAELRYQLLGPYGEPGRTVSLGPVDVGDEGPHIP